MLINLQDQINSAPQVYFVIPISPAPVSSSVEDPHSNHTNHPHANTSIPTLLGPTPPPPSTPDPPQTGAAADSTSHFIGDPIGPITH